MYSFSRLDNNLVIFSAILCLGLISGEVKSQFMDTEEIIPYVPVNEFYIDDAFDMPCLLLNINATIILEPKSLKNATIQKTTIEVPRNATETGRCGNGQDSLIVIVWNTFKLLFHFRRKFRVSDAWLVDAILFSYNTSEKILEGRAFEDLPGGGALTGVQVVRSPDPFTLWLTPFRKSYSCGIAQEIKILDSEKYGKVTIEVRRIEIQPFAEMTRRQFGDAFSCVEEAGRQNDTLPFVFGSFLVLTALSTVLGYAAYLRYFNVKKVDKQQTCRGTLYGEGKDSETWLGVGIVVKARDPRA